MPPRTLGPLLLSASLLTLACEPQPQDGWAGTTVDSAGLRIVTNPTEPLWSPEEGWWVDEVLRIDPDESVPETLFGYIVDADLDSQGRVYALDEAGPFVRVFVADGAALGTLGGPGGGGLTARVYDPEAAARPSPRNPGRGPGLLGGIMTSLVVLQDTIVVADWSQGHLDRWGPDGMILDPLPMPGEWSRTQGWLEAEGDRLWVRIEELSVEGPEEAIRKADRLFLLEPPEAEPVLQFDYRSSDLGARGAPRLPLIPNAPIWAPLPDGRVAWSTLESAEIRIAEWTGDGPARPSGRIRSPGWRARSPTPTDLEALRILMREEMETRGAPADARDRVPLVDPPFLPVMTDLAAGPDGTLWVQRTGDLRQAHPKVTNFTRRYPGAWGGSTWDVLDGAGRYLGSVELPRRFRLMAFRGDLLVGAVADSRNVDALVVLRVNRPPSD